MVLYIKSLRRSRKHSVSSTSIQPENHSPSDQTGQSVGNVGRTVATVVLSAAGVLWWSGVEPWLAACPPAVVWVIVPAGESVIGDDGTSAAELSEKPRFRINFTSPFKMLETEVTNRQYAANNPWHSPVDDRPVVRVTWTDAGRFCEAINGRLPTELEWEYAARAGGEGPYGRGPEGEEITEGLLDEYAWFDEGPSDAVHDARTKKSNYYGIYGMFGNAWEWVMDGFSVHTWTVLSPIDGTTFTDPGFVKTIGFDFPEYRGLRGGSYRGWPELLRSANRDGRPPTISYPILGFRCVIGPARQPLNLQPSSETH